MSVSLPSPPQQLKSQRRSSPWPWAAFSVCALDAIILFFVPAFIIRPFRHQSPHALFLALALRQRAPLDTLLAAIAAFLMAFALWRTATRWRKTILALTLLVVTISAIMARINYFEWMFHPLATPGFEAEAQSKLDGGETIMAVRLGSDARAYPISEMAYHHILNDVVNGVPIAVTY
jgi:hypothetical protein